MTDGLRTAAVVGLAVMRETVRQKQPLIGDMQVSEQAVPQLCAVETPEILPFSAYFESSGSKATRSNPVDTLLLPVEWHRIQTDLLNIGSEIETWRGQIHKHPRAP